jgi:hypothetical protein
LEPSADLVDIDFGVEFFLEDADEVFFFLFTGIAIFIEIEL